MDRDAVSVVKSEPVLGLVREVTDAAISSGLVPEECRREVEVATSLALRRRARLMMTAVAYRTVDRIALPKLVESLETA